MEILELNTIIEEKLKEVSIQTGLGIDQLTFLFCQFLAYPLAIIYSFLPNQPILKHVYGLSIGVWFAWISMRWQILNSFVSSLVVFLLVHVLHPKTSPKVVYLWSMGYLAASHIYRMYTDYMGYTLDFTGPQMLLTLKLTTFAFDYSDGQLPEANMKPYAKLMSFKKLPNLLEFFGYVYFFPGFLAGPAFNYKEYSDFIDGSLFSKAPGGKMPSPLVPFIKTFGTALICSIFVVLNMKFSLYYCRADDFYSHDFLYRLFYVWLAGSLSRFPYYFAWKLSEASSILSGIGFSGVDSKGNPKWERANNAHIINLELAQNFKSITDSWNIRTDKWLKHYVYERVSFSPVAMTFLNSALWHGFYPGYYYSFMTASFIIQVARVIRRSFRPWFLEADGETPKPTKKIYDFVSLLVTSFTLNYIMTPFVLLGFEYGWKLWSSLFFIGHAGAAIIYILGTFVIRPPKVQKKSS